MGHLELTRQKGTASSLRANGHLVSKLRTGTSKTKNIQICLDEVALFWMSQCVACSPVRYFLYPVTVSCKGPTVCLYLGNPTLNHSVVLDRLLRIHCPSQQDPSMMSTVAKTTTHLPHSMLSHHLILSPCVMSVAIPPPRQVIQPIHRYSQPPRTSLQPPNCSPSPLRPNQAATFSWGWRYW